MADKMTFFESYYTAIMKIKDPKDRLLAFETVCGYGITGNVPDELSDVVAIMFDLVKPNIDTSEKRRKGGAKGGSYSPKHTYEERESMLTTSDDTSLHKNSKLAYTNCVSDKDKEKDKDKEIENISDSKESDCPTQSVEPNLAESANRVIEEWNKLSDIGIKPISRLTDGGKRKSLLYARLRQYGERETIRAIHRIRSSDFLAGKNRNGWSITFDWFILPSNFPKVLEGNYDNGSSRSGIEAFINGGSNDG